MKSIIVCAFILGASTLQAQNDVVSRAMRDEMQRSMQQLQLENLQKPYFISYKVTETNMKVAASTLGNLMDGHEDRARTLTVVVRVGDYTLDSSNSVSMNFGSSIARMFGGTIALPLEDDYQEIRRQIWLATDSTYKKALESLSAKKADLSNRNQTDNTPDFSKAEPTQTSEIAAPADLSLREAEELTKSVSALFRKLPKIQSSTVQLSVLYETEHYLNSEGTSFVRQTPEIAFHASATTQSKDSMEMKDKVDEYGRQRKDLPSTEALTKEVSDMAHELISMQEATGPRRYNGPVLFEDQAVVDLFAHHFVPNLSAQPRVRSGGNAMSSALSGILGGGSNTMLGGGETPLLNRIGARVLPEFLSLSDDPTLKEFDHHLLFGTYKVDEEGVTSRRTELVKDGVLKALLTSRSPVRGILQSSGNMRGNGIAPGNLILSSSKASTTEGLKAKLLELVKERNLEFGVVIRRLEGNAVVSAYRLFPDGKERPMRNVSLSEFTYRSFKAVLAVSNEKTISTIPSAARVAGILAGQGFDLEDALVSYVVPSAMLVEDASIERPSGANLKPPILGSPIPEN